MRTKRIKTIVGRSLRCANRVLRRVIPLYDIFCINRNARKHGNIILKLRPVSINEYCKNGKGRVDVVENGQDRIVYEPPYFPDVVGKEHVFESKDIYIAELNNVEVHSGTGLVIAGEYAVTDMVVNDEDNRVMYAYEAIRRGSKRLFYVESSYDVDTIDCGINLCGLAASNYYHLTIEILSRYEYVRKIATERRALILMDEEAKRYPQLEELILHIITDAEIKYVPLYKRVHCKTLFYPSMNTWMPINVKRRDHFRIADNLIADSAVRNIRNAAQDYMRDMTGIKIFVSRKNSSLPRIINEEEVAEIGKKYGYTIVCTDRLSYKEQVELFSSASCVIGATGAALTNVVYCHPGAVLGCIIPREYEFYIYSSLARMAGCYCEFLDAKVMRKRKAISSEQYKVDIEEFSQFLELIEKGHCRR